jgi:putative oxidoreductase
MWVASPHPARLRSFEMLCHLAARGFLHARSMEPIGPGFVFCHMNPLTTRNLLDWIFVPPDTAPRSTLLVRVMAGSVFLSEGILKFVYTNQGVGRFTKLGLPFPDLTANFVASLEIVGGLLLITGLLTRAIAIPFIIEMIVAILSTKISLYLGTSPLPLPPAPPKIGFWAVAHEIRSDYAQIVSCAFLLIVGAGPWSLDAFLHKRRQPSARPAMVEHSTAAIRF